MLPHLDRKLLRDLRRLKGQAIAVSVVMACGLMMMIMARSLIASLDGTRADYYESNRFAEIFTSLKRAPNYISDRIAAIPGVAGVQTDIAGQVTLDLPGLDEPASGLVRSLPDGSRRARAASCSWARPSPSQTNSSPATRSRSS